MYCKDRGNNPDYSEEQVRGEGKWFECQVQQLFSGEPEPERAGTTDAGESIGT